MNELLLALPRNNDVDVVVFCSHRGACFRWVPSPLTIGVLVFDESPRLSSSGCLFSVSSLASHHRGACFQWVSSPFTIGVLVFNGHFTLSAQNGDLPLRCTCWSALGMIVHNWEVSPVLFGHKHFRFAESCSHELLALLDKLDSLNNPTKRNPAT